MEALAEALKKIPDMVGNQLQNLKAMDKESKDLINLLNEEETKFLEELKVKCIAKEIEGTPYVESHQQLVSKRYEVLAKLDLQMKNVQFAYDQIDKKIAYIDNCTKHISHLLPLAADENGSEYRKKKKKRLNTDVAEVLQPDPNEPLYCTCRQVSHGSMVGCENPDCQTEWFHFACVGLIEEPVDPWYCSDCKESPLVLVDVATAVPFE